MGMIEKYKNEVIPAIIGLTMAALIVVAGFRVQSVHPSVVHAQSASSPCDTTISMTIAAAATGTVTQAIAGATPYICAYQLTGDTAATGIQFKASGTALTGAMLTPANGNLTAGNGIGIIIPGVQGATITVTASTGAVTGWVRFGNH